MEITTMIYNETECITMDPVIYTHFLPNNQSSMICSSLYPAQPTLSPPLPGSFIVKLPPHASMLAVVRVVTTNQFGQPSDVLEFETEEDKAVVEETSDPGNELNVCKFVSFVIFVTFSFILFACFQLNRVMNQLNCIINR